MKYGILLIIGVLVGSCGQTTTTNLADNIEQADTVVRISTDSNRAEKKETIYALPIKLIDLQEKIFEIGSVTHFTDTCSFYFECDCCSGELIFNADSTFYYKDYCMS